MIFVPDIIGEVVDSIRTTDLYVLDSSTSESAILNVPYDHDLAVFDWITIDGTDYKITSITDNLVTVNISGKPAIAVSGTYKSLAPYYEYGTRMEIANRLLEKDSDSVFKYQKYPLVALRLPLAQVIQPDIMQDVSLNIAIMTFTDENYTSMERYENVIKPVLAPIYKRFLDALSDSKYVSVSGRVPHNRIDRLYWGVEESEGYVKNIFNDPIDAIELVNLNIKLIDSNC